MNHGRKSPMWLVLPVAGLLLVGGCGEKESASDTEPQSTADVASQPRPLKAQLDSMRNQFAETAPPEVITAFQQGVQDVRVSGILTRIPKVGDTAIDFTLPSATGDSVTLYSLLENGPVVLMWYRGGWCPYCNVQLNTMQQYLPQIRDYNAQLVAVSPELPDSSLSTRQRHNLEFSVLSDVNNVVANRYGLVYTQSEGVNKIFEERGMDWEGWYGNKDYNLPLPATFVIDRNGVIRYAFADADYKVRAEPEDILAALRAASHAS